MALPPRLLRALSTRGQISRQADRARRHAETPQRYPPADLRGHRRQHVLKSNGFTPSPPPRAQHPWPDIAPSRSRPPTCRDSAALPARRPTGSPPTARAEIKWLYPLASSARSAPVARYRAKQIAPADMPRLRSATRPPTYGVTADSTC